MPRDLDESLDKYKGYLDDQLRQIEEQIARLTKGRGKVATGLEGDDRAGRTNAWVNKRLQSRRGDEELERRPESAAASDDMTNLKSVVESLHDSLRDESIREEMEDFEDYSYEGKTFLEGSGRDDSPSRRAAASAASRARAQTLSKELEEAAAAGITSANTVAVEALIREVSQPALLLYLSEQDLRNVEKLRQQLRQQADLHSKLTHLTEAASYHELLAALRAAAADQDALNRIDSRAIANAWARLMQPALDHWRDRAAHDPPRRLGARRTSLDWQA